MVPDTYIAYFTAAAAAAGVLIGLLFVAVTLRPESVPGERAAPLAQATAGSAFTGVTLILRPRDVHLLHNIAYVLIAAFGLALSRAWTLLRGQRLVRPGPRGDQPLAAPAARLPGSAGTGRWPHRAAGLTPYRSTAVSLRAWTG